LREALAKKEHNVDFERDPDCWDKMIQEKDFRLTKLKKMHTIDSRRIYIGNDVQENHRELKQEFKDRCIWVDRQFFPIAYDCNTFEGSQDIYMLIGPEPFNLAEDSRMINGIREYKVTCRSAPCGCVDCRDGNFDRCVYKEKAYKEWECWTRRKNSSRDQLCELSIRNMLQPSLNIRNGLLSKQYDDIPSALVATYAGNTQQTNVRVSITNNK
jgi:hypothetical protein